MYPSDSADSSIEKLKDDDGLLPRTIVPLQRAGTVEDSKSFLFQCEKGIVRRFVLRPYCLG